MSALDNSLTVKIARMPSSDELNLVLDRAHDTDAGFDIRSIERIDLPPHQRMTIGTGVAAEIPLGWCAQVNPRSSIASKHGVIVGACVIDASYRGEIKINLINTSDDTFEIKKGDRIAQLLFLPVLTNVVEVPYSELSDTTRGVAGFGSTGVA